jgi:hypothetical protein
MHRIPAWIGVAVVVTALAQGAGAATDKVIVGNIQIPEISGVAFLPGDRLLVVADDPFPPENGHSVFLLKNASQHLQAGKILVTDFEPVTVEADPKDLEDVAWDRGSNVFIVTSQSRNRRGEDKKKRSMIVRLGFDDDGIKSESVLALQGPSDFEEAKKRTAAQVGFNIEGAAWSREGHLLLGLRAPTSTAKEERPDESNEDAILLDAGDAGSNSLQPSASALLRLNGNGIRGMFYDFDAKGLWILAGISPDLRDGLVREWALWFRQDDGKLKPILLPSQASTLDNAEAVTRVSLEGTPYLLVVEDGACCSNYVLFPVPQP